MILDEANEQKSNEQDDQQAGGPLEPKNGDSPVDSEPVRHQPVDTTDQMEVAKEEDVVHSSSIDKGALRAAFESMGPLGIRLVELNTQLESSARLNDRAACRTLLRIVENILKHPGESKYQQFRQSSKSFQRNLASSMLGIEMLKALGFSEESSGDGSIWLWKRKDLGLLYAGKSLLESHQSVRSDKR